MGAGKKTVLKVAALRVVLLGSARALAAAGREGEGSRGGFAPPLTSPARRTRRPGGGLEGS